jgi:hypothetical protein
MEQSSLFRYYCFATNQIKKERKAAPSMNYIISYKCDLENQEKKEIVIEPPEEMAAFFRKSRICP